MSHDKSAQTTPEKKSPGSTEWVNSNPYLALAKDKDFQAIIRSLPKGSGLPCFGRYTPSNKLFEALIHQLNWYHKHSYSENSFYAQLLETAKDYGLMKEGFRGGRSLVTLISVFFCVSALIITPVTVNYLMPFLESVLSAGTAHAFTAVACVLGIALAVTLAFGVLDAFFEARHTPMLLNALWANKKGIDALFDQKYRRDGDDIATLLGVARGYDDTDKKTFKQTIALEGRHHVKTSNDCHAEKRSAKSTYVSFSGMDLGKNSITFTVTPLKADPHRLP